MHGFLKSYAGNQATYHSYRTHVECLLLWSALIVEKPLIELHRRDAEAFMEFYLHSPADWSGPVVKARFERHSGRKPSDSDTYHVNEIWSHFTSTVPKRDRKASESMTALPSTTYKMSQGSVAQVFAVCGSFFQHAIDEGFTEVRT